MYTSNVQSHKCVDIEAAERWMDGQRVRERAHTYGRFGMEENATDDEKIGSGNTQWQNGQRNEDKNET